MCSRSFSIGNPLVRVTPPDVHHKTHRQKGQISHLLNWNHEVTQVFLCAVLAALAVIGWRGLARLDALSEQVAEQRRMSQTVAHIQLQLVALARGQSVRIEPLADAGGGTASVAEPLSSGDTRAASETRAASTRGYRRHAPSPRGGLPEGSFVRELGARLREEVARMDTRDAA